MTKAVVFTDGGNRKTVAASAFYAMVTNDERVLERSYQDSFIHCPTVTNNVAEYYAVVIALTWARSEEIDTVSLRSDSQLIVNQIKGEWKIREKGKHLEKFRDQCWSLAEDLEEVQIKWIPREQNAIADQLCRDAMNGFVIQHCRRFSKA